MPVNTSAHSAAVEAAQKLQQVLAAAEAAKAAAVEAARQAQLAATTTAQQQAAKAQAAASTAQAALTSQTAAFVAAAQKDETLSSTLKQTLSQAVGADGTLDLNATGASNKTSVDLAQLHAAMAAEGIDDITFSALTAPLASNATGAVPEAQDASSPADAKWDPSAPGNPQFPSGTPVPGKGTAAWDLGKVDALSKSSDLAKYLQAADPGQVDTPAASGEHGQLHHTIPDNSDTKLSELAAKAHVNGVVVNGGSQLLIYDAGNNAQLYDAATGANLTDRLPTFASGSPPSSTVLLIDGSRIDMKGKDGTTIVSGNSLTTFRPGEAPQIIDDAAAVRAYMQGTAVNPLNTAV